MPTKKKKKIVLAHGVFDVLHHGHVAHLKAASEMGDQLLVSITHDDFVNKGPGRPVFNHDQRAMVVAGLQYVWGAFITQSDSAVGAIEKIEPDIYIKGKDYRDFDTNGMLDAERKAVQAHGGKLVFTDTELDSSSRAINQIMPTLPDAALRWLDLFRRHYSYEDVDGWLSVAAVNSFAVLGEAIADEYVFVEPRNKSPKENVITYVPTGKQTSYAGGSHVIASHMRNYVKRVELPDWMTESYVTKRRWVDAFNQKVFSLAETTGEWDWPEVPFDAGAVDGAVVADFGHGLFPDDETMRKVTGAFNWIALTVQANSLNWGFNTLRKWNRASYVVVDMVELDMAQPLNTPIDQKMISEMTRLGAGMLVVTRGHEGAMICHTDRGGPQYLQIPAFSNKPIDRIGAGDAFLAYTSPLVKSGAHIMGVALVGACAAAIHVETEGNRPVPLNKLKGFIKSILA